MKLKGKIKAAWSSRPMAIIIMGLSAVAGLSLIIFALASGYGVVGDLANGTLTGCASVVSNAGAVHGNAVQFGPANCSSPKPTPSATPKPGGPSSTPTPRASLPSLPLTTNGRFIVSKSNTSARVKLAGGNWYGFEEQNYAPAGLDHQPLSAIVTNMKALGINSVRLPWATDSWNANPVVPNAALSANPSLQGLHLRDLMDRVVNELARQGMMVVLDNHTSVPRWCCSGTDGNALWWEDYTPSSVPNWAGMSPAQRTQLYQQGDANWKLAWRDIVTRFSSKGSDPQPAVVGADLRNEPRNDSTLGLHSIWGGSGTPDYENWPQAATAAGNQLLAINPSLLIMVEGVNYSVYLGGFDDNTDVPANPVGGLRGVAGYPVTLSVPHQLVYAPHNYSWDNGTSPTKLGQWWGYILGKSSYTAPIWLGEFGTCDTSATTCLTSGTQGTWWQTITSYLQSTDADWSYWAVNGTQVPGNTERYGLLNPSWTGEALPALTQSLRAIAPAAQHP
jgi:endoglucanase